MNYEEYIDLILLANYYYISCKQENGNSDKTRNAKTYLDIRIKSALKQVNKQRIKKNQI